MSFTYEYPRPMVTVDALLFAGTGDSRKVLLIKRGNDPFKGKWALPGGFVDMDETLDAAVKRELLEETGICIEGMEQLHTFGKPGRDPRGRNVTVVFTKKLQAEIPPIAGDDAAEAQWWTVNNLPELAFDHSEVILKGLK